MFSVGAYSAVTYSSESSIVGASLYFSTAAELSLAADVVAALPMVKDVSVLESGGAVDVISTLGVLNASVIELAEAATYRQVGYGYSTGAFSSGPFDALGDYVARVSGDIVSTLVNVNSAAVESTALTDRPFTNVILNISVQNEAASIYDQAVGNLTLPASFEDSAQVTDTASYFIAFPATIDESAQGADETSSTPNYATSVSEGVSGQDEASTLAEFGSVVAETVVGIDQPFSNFTVNSAFSDSATVADNPIGNVNFRTVVLDGVVGSDSPTIRLQWELIDTYEASDWVLIDTFTPQS